MLTVPRVLGVTLAVKDSMGWDLAEDFPDRIKSLRNALGMTQAELAVLFGVSAGQISSWERGMQRPHKKNVRRWADQHGWPLEIFLEDGPMPLDTVSMAPRATSEVRVAQALRKISKASEGLSQASRLLADGATEDAEAVLRRVLRVENYDSGEV